MTDTYRPRKWWLYPGYGNSGLVLDESWLPGVRSAGWTITLVVERGPKKFQLLIPALAGNS
jgi:hypothetical protein